MRSYIAARLAKGDEVEVRVEGEWVSATIFEKPYYSQGLLHIRVRLNDNLIDDVRPRDVR